jgi:ElaA protein
MRHRDLAAPRPLRALAPNFPRVIDREVQRATGSTIAVRDLYAALRLRAAVFVVEQDCPYLDPDGRDLEPSTQHLWVDREDGTMVSYLRVLAEPDGSLRIGRVVTDPAHRGSRLSGRLLTAALDGVTGTVVLDAQSHLTHVYERHGFVPDGDEFLDDGIPHTPMRRAGGWV